MTTYRQDPETKEFILLSEWLKKYEESPNYKASGKSGGGPYIMSDIDSYQSTIDGSVITSRSRHREHLREHGCVEVGTDSIDSAVEQRAPQDDGSKSRKEAVIDAYDRAAAI